MTLPAGGMAAAGAAGRFVLAAWAVAPWACAIAANPSEIATVTKFFFKRKLLNVKFHYTCEVQPIGPAAPKTSFPP